MEMENSGKTMALPQYRYRIRASAGGKVKIKFAESCSTELDDESLSPDDSDYRRQLRHHREEEKNKNAFLTYQISADSENENDINQYDERRRLMSDDGDSCGQRNRGRRGIEGADFHASTVVPSGSILLPSTTVTTTAAATNTNFLDDEDDDNHNGRNNGVRHSSAVDSYSGEYGSGGGPATLIMHTDQPYDQSYAIRTEEMDRDSSRMQISQRPRMGRRFTLNPLIFAKEERDARRQSLAQLKLSYYPTNAHPDVYDAGLGICSWSLLCLSWVLVLLTFPISVCFCLKVVQEYERAVIFRLGRLIGGGARGPGIFFVMPCVEHYTKVDLRTVSFSVPPQEILTRDSVTVSVDAVVYYRVSNATVSVANVENAHHSTRLLAQTTLRNMLGMQNLSEILSGRDNLANVMQTLLDDATESWGIKVERVEIKDVRLPIQLQRAMAAEAEAAREARAKVIAAEGEQKASRSLREAARIIAMSPAAIQLRYLQTLNTVAAEKNSTIIFPLPIELIRHFIKSEDTVKAVY